MRLRWPNPGGETMTFQSGHFTLSSTGFIEKANLTASGLLGVRRSTLLEQPLARFILPAEQRIYRRQRLRLLEADARHACEPRMVRRDGESRCVRLEATSVRAASGTRVNRAVVRDISALERAEESLRISELQHRLMFERSHDALQRLAPPEWAFTSVNAATLAMFGMPDEATFLSRAPSDHSPQWQPDGSASTEKRLMMIEAALREGSQAFEWTYRRLSGEEFPATVFLTRIDANGGQLLQAAVRDDTEAKKLQASLRRADRLASVGTLAAGVAHEIGNHLTYVLLNIERLTDELPKLAGAVERCRQLLPAEPVDAAIENAPGAETGMLAPSVLEGLSQLAREALDGTQRIRTISRTIGKLSRVEHIERSPIDLNHAIECAATMAQNMIKSRANFEMDLGPLPEIWAHEGKLSQVFLNLLINAAQAIDEGNFDHNHIRVRTWAEGGEVFAEVKDTGMGIPEDSLSRIFEPFFTTKPAGVGSGLGLHICRSILRDLEGDIDIESELGKGTRIVVRLPFLCRTNRRAAERPRINVH
jgi:two-component system cell cycle sensor histidine kinase/response regulator CckA